MSRFTENPQSKKAPAMKPKTNSEDRSQNSTRRTVVPNARMVDYLRLLNCTRTNAVAPTTENQAQLCHRLFRDAIKRLAVAIILCALCLPGVTSPGSVGAAIRLNPADLGTKPIHAHQEL